MKNSEKNSAKNSVGKKDLKTIERLQFQIEKYGITFKIGLCAILLLLSALAARVLLRLDGKVFLFFLGFDAIICAQFALFVKERNKSKLLDAFVSTMTNTTKGCCWIWNVAAGHLHFTPKGHVIFGRDIETYKDFLALIHPDDVGVFEKAVTRFRPSEPSSEFSSGETFAFEVEFRAQSVHGDWRWFVIRSSAVEYAANEVVRVMGSMLDIDAYKRAVEAMRSSERQLEAIFRNAPGSMAVMNSEGNLIDANQVFYDMLGYGAKELQGTPIMSLSKDYAGKNGKDAIEEVLRECESYEDTQFHMEGDFICRSGQNITLEFGIAAIFDFDGNILNYIFSGIDITLQKKHSAELKLLTEKQRWLFDFLQQFNQFEGIAQLFDALKENLPKAVSFSSLSLVVPSFLDKPWALDSAKELDAAEIFGAVNGLLAGNGPLGQAYIDRTPITRQGFPADQLSRHDAEYSHSILAVPLTYRDTTWGIMKLEGTSEFTDQDVTLMSILGGNIGLYFEEQSDRSELDAHAQHLQRLHSLIHSLLRTQNRDHLLDGMLQYLKEVVADSVCAVYLFVDDQLDKNPQLECLAGYEEDNIPMPDSALVWEAISRKNSLVEYNEKGMETRRVSPLIFQTHSVGAVDLYKPSGLLPAELKMYQLLVDYVAGFWVLYDLMAVREEEAFIDPLTGIWNRRYMIRRLQEESDRIARYGGNACLIIGDMGNFKHTNDNYGHSKGDEVLLKAAAAIKKNLRLSDSVGRYGGDEFILLLPNVSIRDAEAILKRIEQELENLQIKSDDTDPDSPNISVVMDFGLAIYPGKATTLMETINVADEAMYANKMERKKEMKEVARA
ncbi:MAG: diguanylate cyclase [Synergistaceae bacterium]|jgi:diguanylate cyclase (GGDEF)-like protein/PAS domain S-box-containing protein|nr:diguanylate cyclase [Synergistaceae bacterium]